MHRLIFAFLFAAIICPTHADEIVYFKNKRAIRITSHQESSGWTFLLIDGGQMAVPTMFIEKIVSADTAAPPESESQPAKGSLKPQPQTQPEAGSKPAEPSRYQPTQSPPPHPNNENRPTKLTPYQPGQKLRFNNPDAKVVMPVKPSNPQGGGDQSGEGDKTSP